MSLSPLNLVFGLPIIAALGLLLVPKEQRVVIRGVSVVASLVSLGAALALFLFFNPNEEGFQFVQFTPWIAGLGVYYHLGVDGINLCLVLMGAIVGFASVCVAAEIKTLEKEFHVLLLLMIGGILGAFCSLDILLLYLFHELALIPTFIMIGVWGRGERRNYAAFQIAIYLTLGALIALVGLLALYVQSGARTFDLIQLTRHLQSQPLTTSAQHLIFPILLIGLGILVPLWPFHTWAPLAYASAPTATAMMHAGVIKKFGLYALLRIAIPLMPDGARPWMQVIAWLCLGNLLFCGLVAMRQKNLNMLLGNSSVSHMGFVFLGLASWNLIGLTGAVVVMVAHGFLAALSFALSGYLHRQTGTLEMDQLGGLWPKMPFIGWMITLAFLAGCGLPGFANFVGEILVIFASWETFSLVTFLALWTALIIGAVYMLRAIRRVLHGDPLPQWSEVYDVTNGWRRLPYVLLLISLLMFGCYPRLLTDRIKPAVSRYTQIQIRKTAPAAERAHAQLDNGLPTPQISPGKSEAAESSSEKRVVNTQVVNHGMP